MRSRVLGSGYVGTTNGTRRRFFATMRIIKDGSGASHSSERLQDSAQDGVFGFLVVKSYRCFHCYITPVVYIVTTICLFLYRASISVVRLRSYEPFSHKERC